MDWQASETMRIIHDDGEDQTVELLDAICHFSQCRLSDYFQFASEATEDIEDIEDAENIELTIREPLMNILFAQMTPEKFKTS